MTDPQRRVYIGTYTRKTSKGVHLAEFAANNGTLSMPQLVAETVNPSFLAVHPNGRFLYAVGETGDFQGEPTGFVSAFAIDRETAALTPINQVASGGGAPCFISIDATGRTALVANYSGGSVAAFAIQPDGSLSEAAAHMQHEGTGPDPDRQQGPHAHSIVPDPTGRFALAADLGLDRVFVYRLDAERSTLTEHGSAATPPEAGPRHLAFHPGGRFVYAINEMGGSVTAFAWDADAGSLDPLGTVSTLPGEHVGARSAAHVQLHPSGRFLYASNREGHHSIAVFTVNEKTGALTPAGHVTAGGQEPRHFTLDPRGEWLLVAHQNSDSVLPFRVDTDTGRLTGTQQRVEVSMPVCVCFAG